MVRQTRTLCVFPRRKGYSLILASLWCLGLICGILYYITAEPYLFSLMRRMPSGAMSIVSSLCSALLPFLLSAVGLYFFDPLLLPVCFLRAFLYAFVSMGVLRQFGSAGWMFHGFLMFHSWLMLPVFCFFWLRDIQFRNSFSGFRSVLLLSLAFLSGSMELRILFPVFAGVLSS